MKIDLKKDEILRISILLLGGALFSILPHLLAYLKQGSFLWIADNDDLFYLSLVSKSLFNNSYSILDPSSSSLAPLSYYTWFLVGPIIIIGKLFHLEAAGIGLVWRIWGGVSMTLLHYFLFRALFRSFKSKWLSFSATLFIMVDMGLMSSRPLLVQGKTLFTLFFGNSENLFSGKPHLFPHLRIITPAVSLVFLLIAIYFLYKAVIEESKKNTILSGMAFGLLFYVYFYYWTAFGLGLLLSIALDWKKYKTYLYTGVLGTLIGLPSVILKYFSSMKSLSDDWLHRMDLFLPIEHFSELLIHKTGILITVFLGIYCYKRKRELIFLFSLGLASLMLANHQILTGLQIQNFHYSYVRGPVLSLFLVFLLFGTIYKYTKERRLIQVSMFSLLGLYLVSSFYLRTLESQRSADSLAIRGAHGQLSQFKTELVKNAVVAGEEDLIKLMGITHKLTPLSNYFTTLSPNTTDEEWNERLALNALLSGESSQEFKRAQSEYILKSLYWGKWSRSKEKKEELNSTRIQIFEKLSQEPLKYIDYYNVRYLLVKKSSELIKELLSNSKVLEERGALLLIEINN